MEHTELVTELKLGKFSFNHYLHWLEVLLDKIGVDPHIGINVLLVALVVIGVAYWGGKRYRQGQVVEPDKAFSLVAAVGFFVESLFELCTNQIGKLSNKTFWLLASFFIFILFSNLWGLIPGFLPPTESLSFTFGIAILSFILYNFIGFRIHGWSYLKHFLGPMLAIAPLIGAIEIISHLVRPLTLGLRLFGNISGDHFVVNLFTEEIFPVLMPVPFMFLGIFISVVQAFVFFQLSLVYVSGSSAEEH